MKKKQAYQILSVFVIITLVIIGYCLLVGNEYTVIFDANGGSEVEKMYVETGKTIGLPKTPVREGYKFVGWQLDGEDYDFTKPIRQNITLKAKWLKVSSSSNLYYVVSFDSMGGSEVSSQYIMVSERAVKPTTPVKEGYEFKGWYYNDTKFDFNKAISQDITLVAHWEKN